MKCYNENGIGSRKLFELVQNVENEQRRDKMPLTVKTHQIIN